MQKNTGDQRSKCTTTSTLQATENKETHEVEESGNIAAFSGKRVKFELNQLFPSPALNSSPPSKLLRTPRFQNGDVKRTPFRELNFDSEQREGKQTIWRPWSMN